MELVKGEHKYFIYFLLRNKQVIYIGHTRNLISRVNSHTKKGYESVRFFECASKLDALRYERRWINLFKPTFNGNGTQEKGEILNFKVSEHLKNAILKSAQRSGLKPSEFIRAVVKKHIKYKEPDLL